MAIPDFQTVMLPLLECVSDGKDQRHGDVFEALVDRLGITGEERSELLPSGVQGRFENRVRWAKWYLTKAGLLEKRGRGTFCISDRGRGILQNPPEKITVGFLQQFPEFVDEEDAISPVEDQTPQEQLAVIHKKLDDELAHELVDRVMNASPRFFEELVVDLLVAMGYGGSRRDAGEAVGRTGDGGIDGIIREDKLGLDAVYIQAKRWSNSVGAPAVQAFAGSLEGHRARKGVFITTSSFTREAKQYVERIEKKIVLIDGDALTGLMIEHGVAVRDVETFAVKELDEGYFVDEPVIPGETTQEPPP